jgi:hypothetical protein
MAFGLDIAKGQVVVGGKEEADEIRRRIQGELRTPTTPLDERPPSYWTLRPCRRVPSCFLRPLASDRADLCLPSFVRFPFPCLVDDLLFVDASLFFALTDFGKTLLALPVLYTGGWISYYIVRPTPPRVP